jgi:hypothetical protein
MCNSVSFLAFDSSLAQMEKEFRIGSAREETTLRMKELEEGE